MKSKKQKEQEKKMTPEIAAARKKENKEKKNVSDYVFLFITGSATFITFFSGMFLMDKGIYLLIW